MRFQAILTVGMKIIVQILLARSVQDFPILARKASFLVQVMQDLMQLLQEKYLQDLHAYLLIARQFLLGPLVTSWLLYAIQQMDKPL